MTTHQDNSGSSTKPKTIRWAPMSAEVTFEERGVEVMVSLYTDGDFTLTVGNRVIAFDPDGGRRWTATEYAGLEKVEVLR